MAATRVLGDVMGEETVIITVGSHKRKNFVVHKQLLCDASEFFAKAFKGGFKEAEEGVMEMLDDDPDAFAWFVTWLYRSEVPEGETVFHQRILYNLYMLGEKLLLNELVNKTMDRVRENHAATHKVSGASSRHSEYVGMLYDNTLEDSPIRKFIVQMMAYDYYNSSVESGSAGLIGREALQRLWEVTREHGNLFEDFFAYILTFSMVKCPPNPSLQLSSTFDNCRFHRHESGEICYLRMTQLNTSATSATPPDSLASSQNSGAVPASQSLFVFGRN
ncbi:hypothetical protein LZ554_002281 [Drepanopeziza brunnea f. sp. 'monogermtubi']|nr:hypothetical protein LZ554_002281 [Drepanopeziza brunnea f. sp. 'monogermtubi']